MKNIKDTSVVSERLESLNGFLSSGFYLKRHWNEKYIEEKGKENFVNKIAELDKAEKEYYMTTAYLVELGSRSSDIFSRSKPHEKRALLNFVLSNRELDGEKVLYKAKFPFDMVLKYVPSSNWLSD